MKTTRIILASALALAFSILMITPSNHVHADEISTIAANNDIISINEEKIYSRATLDEDFADDKIIVIMKHEASMKFKEYSTADFPEISGKSATDIMFATTQMVKEKITRKDYLSTNENTSNLSNYVRGFRQIIVIELEERGKDKVLEAIQLLENRDDILYVGPELYIEYTPFVETDDKYQYQQWAPEKIDLLDAFEEVENPALVRVGVLDTGVDPEHEDLYGRVNVGLSRDCVDGYCVSYDNYSYPLRDEDGHGTQVASIIGAGVGNRHGIIGTALNVEIVSLRVDVGYDDDIPDTPLAFSCAINYANQIDLPILNMSVGYVGNGYHEDLLVIRQAIANYDGLIVCAAGNAGLNIDDSGSDYTVYDPRYDTFPAEYDYSNIISVGASTKNDYIADFSNYGLTQVDIFAPGADILVCNPERLCDYHNSDSEGHEFYGYHKVSGTSFAAPYVTGVAALVLSKCPNLNAAELKTTILNCAEQISSMQGECVTGGRLNAYNAVTNIFHLVYDTRVSSGSSLTHNTVCSTCGTVSTEAHVWTGECEDYGSLSTHYVHCCECGDSTTEAHNTMGNYESYSSASSHYVYCTKCGGKSTESHSWIEQPLLNSRRCRKCQKVIVGDTPIIKDSIIAPKDDDE